jgi:hypothetical protein
MSCGATEKLVELTQSIGSTNDIIDKLIDKIPITPAQNQSIADAAAIIAMASDAAAIQELVTSKLKGLIPEIDIPFIPDSVQNDFTNVVQNILTAQLAAEDLANELTRLEQKWSGVDLGNIRIQDIPQLLRSGALDLDRICKLVPNFEKDGSQIVLKGTPISFPEINVADILKGGSLPNIQVPDFAEVVTRRVQKGTEKFINISVPGLYRG